MGRTRKVKKTGRPDQCQCVASCKRKSLPGKAFCKDHLTSCPRVSPLSGSEPSYDPSRWNKKMEIRETHNCYSYAMNVNDPKQIVKCKGRVKCNAPFHQPGIPAGYNGFKAKKPKTCPNMIMRMLGDNPNLKMTTFEGKCPSGSSKIALVADQSDDYHYLRADDNGYWSQKSGARPVTNLDAGGHRIWDPQLCDLNYSNHEGVLNYDVFCGYMCVPRNKPLFMRASSGGSRTSSAVAKPFRTRSTRRRS